jgi:hypothetical protein
MSRALNEAFKCPKTSGKLPGRSPGTSRVFAFSDCGFGANKREERTLFGRKSIITAKSITTADHNGKITTARPQRQEHNGKNTTARTQRNGS